MVWPVRDHGVTFGLWVLAARNVNLALDRKFPILNGGA
jgi:hypothetical protein